MWTTVINEFDRKLAPTKISTNEGSHVCLSSYDNVFVFQNFSFALFYR
jgi:hypothetical protein